MATKEQYERRELERAASELSPEALAAARRVMEAAGSDYLRGALFTRVMNALARSTAELDDSAVSEASSAPSDYAVLLRLLGSPRVMEALAEEDPLADARLRGLEARARLLEAEGDRKSVV